MISFLSEVEDGNVKSPPFLLFNIVGTVVPSYFTPPYVWYFVAAAGMRS